MRFFSSAGLRRAALGVVIVAAVTGAGCSNAAPGVVAYVGDTEISQKQVDTAVSAVSTTIEEGQQVSTEAVVNAMIQGALAEQIAADKKIALTDPQRDALLKTSTLAP
ncbi:MAG: SurA N-terminal domain-containing protein, partial [Propionibacteriaceae bacterium]|nr:SurA N-terminal domain-containing protein [Propionibacteriaceae bacterium]